MMTPNDASRLHRRFLLPMLLPLVALVACADSSTGPDEPFDMQEVEFAPELGVDLAEMRHLGDQLYIQDLEDGGDGALIAQPDDTLEVHYTGWLPDGTKFDSSRARGEPFVFVLDETSVIEGWHVGLEAMEEGGVRRLVIPPALGYGASGAGGGVIPPNSALVFDVELLAIGRPEG